MTKNQIILGIVAVVGLLLGLLWNRPTELPTGSIETGDEYLSTTTHAGTASIALLKTGQGSLGSVILTANNRAALTLYDATTTDINKRTGQKATTTIVLASFPILTATGTYIFDSVFVDGLLVDFSATIPTTTITWR